MDREILRGQLTRVLKEKLHLNYIDELHDELRLNEDLRIDSIMIVQLIVYVETELHYVVPDDEVDPRTFSTVGSLLHFIESLTRLKSPDVEDSY